MIDMACSLQLHRHRQQAGLAHRDEGARPTVGQLVGKLALGVERAEMNDPRAAADRREERDRMI